jgi:catechol 2,3-dioxygenase-like lactoylglutathione lyase family enzyme
MAEEWALGSVFHFTVNATSFERSLAFYQKLGFRLLRDNRDVIWPAEVAENFGMARAQGRGALLALGPAAHHVRLDLIEWLEPRWEGPPRDVPPAERVPRIIAIRTRNLRAAHRELAARGIEFIREPRDPDPALGIESVVCCRDPDGTLIELIEYMPGVLGSRIEHLPRRPVQSR